MQTVAPDAEFHPAGQFVHALTPARLYRPAGQVGHDVDAEFAFEYVPAAHVVHPPEPALEAYRPNGQFGHDP